MAKRKFTLTDKERQQLIQAYEMSKDVGARTRYKSVRLYGEGYVEFFPLAKLALGSPNQ